MKEIEGPVLPDDVDRKTFRDCKKRFPPGDPAQLPYDFPKAILERGDHEQGKQGSD